MDYNEYKAVNEGKQAYNIISFIGFAMSIIVGVFVIAASTIFGYVKFELVIGIYIVIILSLIFSIIGYIKLPVGSSVSVNRISIIICSFLIFGSGPFLIRTGASTTHCSSAVQCVDNKDGSLDCRFYKDDGSGELDERHITCDGSRRNVETTSSTTKQ